MRKHVEARQESNGKILKLLSGYLKKYPDMRFCQALLNLGIVFKDCDQYYEESVTTLEDLLEQMRNDGC